MGIEDVFQKAAVTAANVFDGVFKPITYQALGSSSYNASTGAVAASTVSETTKMMDDKYTKYEIDNEKIKPADIKGIIPQLNLSVIPNVDDQIKRLEANASVVYDVLAVGTDPANVMWELQLRKR